MYYILVVVIKSEIKMGLGIYVFGIFLRNCCKGLCIVVWN